MSLKTSFCNKSIVKSDIKRMWWVGFIEALLMFVSFVLPILNRIITNSAQSPHTLKFISSVLYTHCGGTIFCVFAAAYFLAVALFSYINTTKSVTSIHSLPIKRSGLYFSQIIGGIILWVVPIVFNALVLGVFRFILPVNYRLIHILMWAAMLIAYGLVIFSLTSMVMLITGNSIAGSVLTPIIACLPIMIEGFLVYFFEENLYGYSNVSGTPVSEFLYVLPDTFWESGVTLIKYLAFSIIFIIAGFLLYKRRKLENSEEVIAFNKLKKVFVYGIALYAGALGYAYFNGVLMLKSILYLIPFGIVAIIAAQMLVNKSLKIKLAIKPVIFYCVFVMILDFAFEIDLFGFERRIPDADKIESVSIQTNNMRVNNSYSYTRDGEVVFYDDKASFSETGDIAKVIALQKYLIDNRDFEYDDIIKITYTFDNGKTMNRSYRINCNEQKNLIKPIFDKEEIRKLFFPIMNDSHREYISISLLDERTEKIVTLYPGDGDKFERIIEALRYDTAHTDYDKYAVRNESSSRVSVSCKRLDGVYEDETPVIAEFAPETHEDYYVHSDYKRTKAFFKELGMYDNLLTANDIKFIGIDFYDDVAVDTKDVYNEMPYDKKVDVNDYQEVYDFVFNTDRTVYDTNANVRIVFNNDRELICSYNTNHMNIPDSLR